MSISEQVKELRKYCTELKEYGGWWNNHLSKKIKAAADTIEFLSAKLADMEQPAEDYSCGWIYCGNGKNLPEETGFYMVTKKVKETGERFIGKGYFNTETGWNEPLKFIDIVAWHPKLEPYHEP